MKSRRDRNGGARLCLVRSDRGKTLCAMPDPRHTTSTNLFFQLGCDAYAADVFLGVARWDAAPLREACDLFAIRTESQTYIRVVTGGRIPEGIRAVAVIAAQPGDAI